VNPAVLRLLVLLVFPLPQQSTPADTARISEVFAAAAARHIDGQSVGDILASAGRMFVGSPYEAGTLGNSTREELVVDLHSFDCTTFIETSLALARCIRNGRRSFDDFSRELKTIRYRNGILSGYSSRLHYMLDWITDNQERGIVTDVSGAMGGTRTSARINFMTAHRKLYPALEADSVFEAIRKVESRISRIRYFRIPAAGVGKAQNKIRTGDLIMFTTSQAGLDVRHNGIAIREQDGTIRLLHASEAAGAVQVSPENLQEYVAKHRWATGIIVVRPM
jgi:hypothetical protein